jgi:hypothetical protein
MPRAPLRLALLLLLAGSRAPAAATPARAPAAAPAPSGRRTTAVTRARSAADTSARARSRVGTRMLDDIHIEGEIPVPQVLFITARDQRRFMEFQHHRYQKTSVELGRATATPSRVVVTAPAPVERKENQR